MLKQKREKLAKLGWMFFRMYIASILWHRFIGAPTDNADLALVVAYLVLVEKVYLWAKKKFLTINKENK